MDHVWVDEINLLSIMVGTVIVAWSTHSYAVLVNGKYDQAQNLNKLLYTLNFF